MAEVVVGSGYRHALIVDAAAGKFEGVVEGPSDVGDVDPVLGAFGSRQGRTNRAEIQFQGRGVDRFHGGVPPQPLGLGVGLDQGEGVGGPTGQFQVADGLAVNGEETAGGAVFRGHVGNGGAVSQGQVIQAVAVELDELADHAVPAEHLHHAQHKVGGGDAFRQRSCQPEAHHLGDQHGDRLTKHGRLRLDAADAPAEDAEAVDHGGVAVGAHQGVGIGQRAAVLGLGPHGAGEVFQVDLVADASTGRHEPKVVEGALSPAEEPVALAVALHLDRDVALEGVGVAEAVDHDRVVDHQVDGRQGIDDGGILAGRGHRAAHGGEIRDTGNAGEILHEHACRSVGDLARSAGVVDPVRQRLDVLSLHRGPVLEPQQVLQQNLERHRQPCDIADAGLSHPGEAEIVVPGVVDVKALPCRKGVDAHGGIQGGGREGVRILHASTPRPARPRRQRRALHPPCARMRRLRAACGTATPTPLAVLARAKV